MIHCRILGPISLTASDGRVLDDVVSQPRRLALLAYLAMQASRGFVRRDALLALFWPDQDQDRARRALRQALYVLRAALGDQVIISRGAEEVAIAPESLSYDAAEFERALDAKQWARALELYRGDFLESFYINEAPEFEQWMQAQQGRLRLRAATAHRSLAGEFEAAGATAQAAVELRRALALNGTDEEALRQLIALLDQEGDRAGAVRAYESFVRHLSDQYGVAPSAETKALCDHIRQREYLVRPNNAAESTPPLDPSDDHTSQASPSVPAPVVVGVSSPPATSRPARRRLNWTIGAATLLLASAILVYMAPWAPPATAAAPERVVILPFNVRGGAEHAYLREALIDLLSTDLDGSGGIQTIDPNTVLSATRSLLQPVPDDGRAIARRLGARYFVLGQVVAAGARLRVRSALYDQGKSEPIVQASREGTSEQLFDIVDGLAADLLVGAQRTPGDRLRESAALTTRSLPALKAYLEGESAFRTGELTRANDALQRAVAIDSTFSLAYYRLSVVVDAMSGPWTEVHEFAERALRHATRLSLRDRLLLEAHVASVAEDVVEAERRYRAILASYPDELEAWYRLAEVIFHQNSITARPLDDSRPPFHRLLELDSTNRAALQHLARLAALERRTAELDSLYRRMIPLRLTADEELETRGLHVFLAGTGADKERFIEQLRSASATGVALSIWVTAIFTRDLPAAERMMRVQLGPTRTEDEHWTGYEGISMLQAARGRMHEAATELRLAEVIEPTRALEQSAFLAILPYHPVRDSALRNWRSRLASWRPPRGAARSMTNNDIAGPWRQHMRLYLLGFLDGLLRDPAAVRADADSLETIGVPPLPDAFVFARELAQSVRAHALWRDGNAAAALAALEATRPARPYHYRNSFTRTYDRYLLAELLFQNGRYDDALRWYSSFESSGVPQLVFAAPAHFRRGQIHERLGDARQATEHYQQFLTLWQAPDPELRPMAIEAARRIQAVQSP